ncbi:hypothetical protein BJY04DRAFT_214259 [Aspergillus karnatakaensis]|uniref:phytanoyl-CoA dioxygenase family protein n=1 Tax=Aspergillus karnatakaensis TaxID=1810916 RepID=UPI003CCE23FF
MPSATLPTPETDLQEKNFYVNDGLLPPESIGLLEPATLDTPLEEMQRRYHEDGYLLVKNVLPREDVLRVRRKYFEMLAPTNCLAPGSDPVSGIFDTTQNRFNFPGVGAGPPDYTGSDPEVAELFNDLALKAHHQDWYKEDLCHHPAIRAFVAKLTGWGDNTLSIRRTLLRNNMPQNTAIGVHYDQIFLRHGEDTFVTAWVPIGDISIEGGGLIYLEKGHDIGKQTEEEFMKRAKEAGMSDEQVKSAYNANMLSGGLLDVGPARYAKKYGRRWLLTGYEAGDVVFHNPYAIHASCINHDPENVIRLGTDLRYVDSSRPWDTRWSNILKPGDGL